MRLSRILFIGFFISLFIITSCVTVVRKAIGFKNPKVESKESVMAYLNESDPTQRTYFMKIDKVKDSVSIYKNFIFGFNSDILLFNGQTGEKYCYQGSEECSGVQLTSAFQEFETNYSPCPSDSQINFKNFLSKLENEKGEPVELSSLPKSDYYIFQTWNKYRQSQKYFEEDLEWLLNLKKDSNLSVSILFLNTDLLDDWGLKKGKEFPIKLKKKGKSLRMTIGNLPLEYELYE